MDLDLFKKLIETPSIYPGENKLCEFLSSYLEELGFTVRKQFIDKEYCENEIDKTRFNILAEKGSGSKSLLFYSHVDTVPIHDKALWKTKPLTFTQDSKNSDIYYGLGTADMKGGLFSILEAVKNIEVSGYKLKVVFGIDEECWSKGSHSLVKDDFLDDVSLGIVPELGNTEPIAEDIKKIILGRRGRYIIKLDVPGKSSHGAEAIQHGINAITQASIIAKEIDDNHQATKSFKDLLVGNQFVKHFHSSVSSLSVPDQAVLYIDRHIVPGEDEQSVLGEIQKIIDDLYTKGVLQEIGNQKVQITMFERPTPASKAYIVDESLPEVDLVKKSILKHYEQYQVAYGQSVADENVMANNKNIPMITLGPVGGNEHGANEWVSIKSIEKLIAIYKDVITNFGKEL